MTTSGTWFAGPRAHTAGAGLLFLLLVFLLFMSSKTGQERYDEAKRRLEAVEVLNLRVDAAVFPLMFEFETSFDALTELERDLRLAAASLDSLLGSEGSAELVQLMDQKLTFVEDFKSRQAVLRNSRLIAAEAIQDLWDQELPTQAAAAQLFAVERAYLVFLSRRDPPSAEALRTAIADSRGREISTQPQWPLLAAHSMKFTQVVEEMGALMQVMFFLPIPQVMAREDRALGSELATAGVTAFRYRIALFAIAVLLLTFSGVKVAQVRRYVRAIERANDELEHRVRERTEELSRANEGLVSEIRYREEVESQLRIAQKLEAVGQLAAGVAHEINTPTQYVSDNLAFLSGAWQELTRLLEDYERSVVRGDVNELRSREVWQSLDASFLREEIPSALAEAKHGLEQIAGMVLAMKDFSNPSAADELTDINIAIETTITVARHEWMFVAEVTRDLDPSLPLVPCNVSAINHVILNLIVNAAQAIAGAPQRRRPGRIHVSSARLSDHVEIAVEDDGPGVPAEIADRIFDPFFTTKDVGKGTGQGLTIAYQVIARQHGGTLTLEPGRIGTGARFVVRLPLTVSVDSKADVRQAAQ